MDKISFKEAKDKKLKYYYTGKKCKNGHDSVRLVKGGSCKECKITYAKKYRDDISNKQKIKEYHKDRHLKLYSTEKRREIYEKSLEKSMFYRAKKRAENKKIEFSICLEDIVIPEKCPILGIDLLKTVTGKKENSPSLDRKDSSVGYTKDNIVVVSNRANRIKSDATVDEIEKIFKYMKGI